MDDMTRTRLLAELDQLRAMQTDPDVSREDAWDAMSAIVDLEIDLGIREPREEDA